MVKYQSLRIRFDSGHVAGDPWVHVDSFVRASIFRKLSGVACNVVPVVASGSSSDRPEPSSISTVEDRSVIPANEKSKKRAYFSNIPREEISKAVEGLRGETSKD